MTTSVTITLSYEDYLAATRLRTRQHWLRGGAIKLIVRCAVASAILILGLEALQGRLTISAALEITKFCALWSIAFFFFIIALNVWYLPHTCKRLFKEQPSMGQPHEISFGPDGIKSAGPYETADLPWSHILGWLEDKRTILLSKNSLQFFCLPKVQLGEENLTALKQCLGTAGIKQRV